MYDLALLNGRCYIEHDYQKKNIYVKEGKIASITDAVLPALNTQDLEGLTVYPGFIDPHVHLKLDLGEFVSVDDFESGSKAAAYGGVTTLIDFLDPILKNESLQSQYDKRLKEASSASVDYSFHCTLGNYKDNVDDLVGMIEKLGITSIKVFTTYSDSNRQCEYDVIKKLLSTQALVLAHAEEDEMVYKPRHRGEYEASRSEASELTAIETLIKLVEETKGRLYIVHISSGKTLQQLHVNHLKNHLYLESCPQYYYLSKDQFESKKGNLYLLAPPLRSEISIRLMTEHFNKIDSIGTDHCAFMVDDKMKYEDVNKVPKGIGSLEFAFPLMYDLYGDDVINKMTEAPATIFGLKYKGFIKENYDADFAIVDFNQQTTCQQHHSNSDYTVYEGVTLNLKVVKTIRRGEILMDETGYHPSKGHCIRRSYESNH